MFASQNLQHYMLAHTIHLIEKIDPLKYLLGKAALIGRISKWMMILLEFDIEYIEHKKNQRTSHSRSIGQFPNTR